MLVGDALRDLQTGEIVREATPEERAASMAAEDRDGGIGMILVDGRACYVEDEGWIVD